MDALVCFNIKETKKSNIFASYFFHETCFKEMSGVDPWAAKHILRQPAGFLKADSWHEFIGRNIKPSSITEV